MGGLSHGVISAILLHDDKFNSYKIALVRAINDIATAHPDVAPTPPALRVVAPAPFEGRGGGQTSEE